MSLMRFLNFNEAHQVTHLSEEELKDTKSKLLRTLEEYRNGILQSIRYDYDQRGVVYKKDPVMNVKIIIDQLSEEFGHELIQELSIDSLILKINQIVELKKRNTIHAIKDEFRRYITTFDLRIQKMIDSESAHDDRPSEYFDQEAGEHSVINRKVFTREKYDLDVELAKVQRWVESSKSRVVIVFEGRDSAGKGSTIKKFVENMNPRTFKVVALGLPSEEEKTHWFQRYEKHLPSPGEITLFDRSWYNRAVVEPAMGYCTEDQYNDFMEKVLPWEEDLLDSGFFVIKFWFSITKEKQLQRFDLRKKSLIKYWKFSPNDAKTIDKWEVITKYKNIMLNKTSSKLSPWVVVNANDKRIGSLNAIRYVLSLLPYKEKRDDILEWYPEVITVVS